MVNYKTARTIQVGLVLVIVATIVVVVISIVKAVSANISNANSDTSYQSLLSTDANASVKMSVRGAIVGDDEFRSYQITVTPNKRTMVIYKGYTNTIIKTVDLSNNVAAYKEFVYALAKIGLANGSQSSDENASIGICPSGYVYQFDIKKDSSSIKTLWSSSCSSARGTLSGSYKKYRELFISQITDGQDIIDDIW